MIVLYFKEKYGKFRTHFRSTLYTALSTLSLATRESNSVVDRQQILVVFITHTIELSTSTSTSTVV